MTWGWEEFGEGKGIVENGGNKALTSRHSTDNINSLI